MRIAQLTPGTGHFYCGNCLRDNALAHALQRQGHDVTMIPLYLPVYSELQTPPQPDRVFLGGVNLYLRHKLPAFGRLPGVLRRWLDAPGLLRFSSRRGDMTDAAKHADLTLAMLRCDDAAQLEEVCAMLRWMRDHDRPDVISFCNILLAGLARPIREELDVPLVITMHGEEAFLDALPKARGDEAWSILRRRIRDLDACIAVSEYYAQRMVERLDLDERRVRVVYNGVHLEDVAPPVARGANAAPTIGYLARMCPEKGLHTLVDAFIELRQRGGISGLTLKVAGVQLKADRRYVRDQRNRLRAAGCHDAATFRPNLSRETKLDFLRELDVLSVPATYGEAFGLYVLEALACGVPVVQPRHGAFPELIELTGGGLLCEPDDPRSLADQLQRVLTDRALSRRLAESGRRAVVERFNADRMAREVADVYTAVCQRKTADTATSPASARA